MADYSHYPKALRPKSKKTKEKQQAQRQRVRSKAAQAKVRKLQKAKDKWGNVKKTAKKTAQDAAIGASLIASRGRGRGKGGATPHPKTMKEAGLGKSPEIPVGRSGGASHGGTGAKRGTGKTHVEGLSSKGNPSITERSMVGPNAGYPKAVRDYKASLKEMRSRTEGKREAPAYKAKARDTKSRSEAPTGRPRSKVSRRHKERKPVETKAQRAARELKKKTAPAPKETYGGEAKIGRKPGYNSSYPSTISRPAKKRKVDPETRDLAYD